MVLGWGGNYVVETGSKLIWMENRGQPPEVMKFGARRGRPPRRPPGRFPVLIKCRRGSVNLLAQLGLITAAAASPTRHNASATLKGDVHQASKNT